jgi:hypothetical protein
MGEIEIGDDESPKRCKVSVTLHEGAKSPKSSRAERSNVLMAGSVHSVNSSGRSTSGSRSASLGSPSGESSVDRTYQIMSGASAWRLLQERSGTSPVYPTRRTDPGRISPQQRV